MGNKSSINQQIDKGLEKEVEKIEKKFNEIDKKVKIFSNQKYMMKFVKNTTKSFYKNYMRNDIINKIVNKIVNSDSETIEIDDFVIHVINNNLNKIYKFKLSFSNIEKTYYYTNSYDRNWEKLFEYEITKEWIKSKDYALKFIVDNIRQNLFNLISNDFDVKKYNKKLIIKPKEEKIKDNKVIPIDDPPPYTFRENILFNLPAYEEII